MFNLYLTKSKAVELSCIYDVSLNLPNIPTVVAGEDEEFCPLLVVLIELGLTSEAANADIHDMLFHRQIQPGEYESTSILDLSKFKFFEALKGSLFIVTSIKGNSTITAVGDAGTILAKNPLEHARTRNLPIDPRPYLYYVSKVKGYEMDDEEVNNLIRKLFVSDQGSRGGSEWLYYTTEEFNVRFVEVMSESADPAEGWSYRDVAIEEPLINQFNELTYAYTKDDVDKIKPIGGGWCSENNEWVPVFHRGYLDRWIKNVVNPYIERQRLKSTLDSSGFVSEPSMIRNMPVEPKSHSAGLRYAKYDEEIYIEDSEIHSIMGEERLMFSVTSQDSLGEKLHVKVTNLDDNRTLLTETWKSRSVVSSITTLEEFLVRNPNTYFNLDESPYGTLAATHIMTLDPFKEGRVNSRLGTNIFRHKMPYILPEDWKSGDPLNMMIPTYGVTPRGACLVKGNHRTISYLQRLTSREIYSADFLIYFNVRYCDQIQLHSDGPDLVIPVIMIEAVLERAKAAPSGISSTLYLTTKEITGVPMRTEEYLVALLSSEPVSEFFSFMADEVYGERLPSVLATKKYVEDLPA